MPRVTLQRETWQSAYADAQPLLRCHWREIAHYPDIPLDVDAASYEQVEAAGMLRIYTARLDGKLVGYAAFIVSPSLHYKGSIQAKQDVLYVDPAHRGGTIGARLVKFSDAHLAIEGVQVVMQHVKLSHPLLGRLLVLRGYEPIETLYAKRLDRNNITARGARRGYGEAISGKNLAESALHGEAS
jgi:GNAT superfamily N-acetyltransferase